MLRAAGPWVLELVAGGGGDTTFPCDMLWSWSGLHVPFDDDHFKTREADERGPGILNEVDESPWGEP